jgi:hypothetical protein
MTDRMHELYDPAALNELALLADLMITANATEHPLSQDTIDRELGIGRASKPGV